MKRKDKEGQGSQSQPLSYKDIVATLMFMKMSLLEATAWAALVTLVISLAVAWDSNSKLGENMRNELRVVFLFPVISFQYLAGHTAPLIARMLASRNKKAQRYLSRRTYDPRHLFREEEHVEDMARA